MRFFLLWGFLVWLGASFIFRFFRQIFFDSVGWMVVSYSFVVPFILLVTLPLYRMKKVTGSERIKAAICIALPEMLIDSIVLIYFDNIFVDLPAHTDRFFASRLMWAYAFIL